MSQQTQQSKAMSRRLYMMQIPIFMVSAISVIFFVGYFGASYKPISDTTSSLLLATTIMVAFGDVYGYTVLIMTHARRILLNRDRPDYRRSVIKSGTVLTTSATLAMVALMFGGVTSDTYTYWYRAIVTMTAVSANMVWVFHAYTPFRMLRITSLETALFFITFLFFCTGNMSALTALWPPFADISNWILTVPSVATQRASLLAAAVGSMVLAVRAVLAREPGLVEMEMR